MTQFVVFVVSIGCGVIEGILNSVQTAEQRWSHKKRSKMYNLTKLEIVLFLGILAIFLGAVFDAIGL